MFIPAVGCPPATPSGQPTAGIWAARSQLLSGLAQSKSTKHRFKTKRSQPFLGNDTVKQQFYGFLLAAAAVLLLLLCYLFKWPAAISIAAFVLFELALNAGPNLTTFIIPSLVFPLDIKAEGAGYAAFFGKFGAVIAVFSFPILMKLGGVSLALVVSVAVLGLGAFLTYFYAKKLGLEK